MKRIGVLSGKGGVGKTLTAINLAAGFTVLGKRAVVVDANITTPNVGLYLGSPTNRVTIHHVLKGKNKLQDAVVQHSSGLHFIPGSLAIEDLEKLKLSHLKAVRNLDADYVIIDGAAGLGREALITLENCDEVLVVTNPELPAVTDALKTVRFAEELGKPVKGVIVTRSRGNEHEISLRNIEAMLEYPVVAVVPEDDAMRRAVATKVPLVVHAPDTPAAVAYRKLAATVCGAPFDEPRRSWVAQVLSLFYKRRR